MDSVVAAATGTGYVVAGYALAAGALAGYTAGLFWRGRRARRRAAAVAARRPA